MLFHLILQKSCMSFNSTVSMVFVLEVRYQFIGANCLFARFNDERRK